MTQLVHYEAAKQALSQALRFDDVMKIKSVAEQAALYAKQANDTELIEKATEIRVRAERRAGEMLRIGVERKERASAATGNPDLQVSRPATLAEIGITRDQSSQWQRIASIPERDFETAVEIAKSTAGQVTTAFMLREAKKIRPAGKPKTSKRAKELLRELDRSDASSSLILYVRQVINILRSRRELDQRERDVLGELRSLLIETTMEVCQ